MIFTLSIGDESREKFTFQSVRRLQYSAKLQEKKLRNNCLSVTYRFDKMSFHDKNDCGNTSIYDNNFCLNVLQCEQLKTGTVLVNCIN